MPSISFYSIYIFTFFAILALVVFVGIRCVIEDDVSFRPVPVALVCSALILSAATFIGYLAHKDARNCLAVVAPLMELDEWNTEAMVVDASALYLALNTPARSYQQWVGEKILNQQVLLEGVDYRAVGRGLSTQYFLTHRAASYLAQGTNVDFGCLGVVADRFNDSAWRR